MIPQHGTVEISRARLRHNLAIIKRRIPPYAKICATVKARAYGHSTHVAIELAAAGVDWFCVYSLQEALILSGHVDVPIIVLAPLVISDPQAQRNALVNYASPAIHMTLTDALSASNLAAFRMSKQCAEPIAVHVQIDTGLTRSGAHPDDLEAIVDVIQSFPQLHLAGLYTHLSHADLPGHESLTQQLQTFHRVADPFKKKFPHLLLHAQNSGGAFNHTDDSLDMVRIGIALYGLQPSTATPIADLQPIARVTAPILAIHNRPAGTGVGYGHTFISTRPSRLAIVPVGYADGYPRQLSNRSVAQLHGLDIPVVGRVSMDQIILDITELPAARIGDEVTVISWDPGKPNSLDKMADATNTIGYELATHLGDRLNRVIVD